MRDDPRLQVRSGGCGRIKALGLHQLHVPSFPTQDRFCYYVASLLGHNLCRGYIPDLVALLVPAQK
jgi:hypothetical protein